MEPIAQPSDMSMTPRNDVGNTHNRLMQLVEKMPAFPRSVHRILEITSDINCPAKDIVGVIDHDPVMTMKILKLVNSPYFGLSRRVTSINHAVVLLGINTIKNLAISIATLGVLPQRTRSGLHMNRFLHHALFTAAISKLLAQRRGVPELAANDCFVAGLLHDFGKVVFAQFQPLEYRMALDLAAVRKQALHLTEAEVLGCDHSKMGAMLAEKWCIPQDLVTAIREHHNPDPPNLLILDCVMAANSLAKIKNQKPGEAMPVTPLPASVAERFGMDLVALAEALGDLSLELEKARAFLSA